MNQLPDIQEIRRWQIKPGDRLIVRVDQRLTQEVAAALQARVRHTLQLADDFPVAILDASIDIDVAET